MKAAAKKMASAAIVSFFYFELCLFCLARISSARNREKLEKKTMFASLGFSCAKAFSSPRCNGSPYFFRGSDTAPRGADRFPDTAVLHLV